MKWKSLIGILCIAALFGAGCASKDVSLTSAPSSGEKNGFVDRRTSPPPEAPQNIPPPTEVRPGS